MAWSWKVGNLFNGIENGTIRKLIILLLPILVVCDLGVDVDSSLKFDGHINHIVAKAYSRICILFRGFFSRDIAFLRKAYTVTLDPYWNMHQMFGPQSPHFIKYINFIENVQRHFTKRISSITELPYLERLAVMDLELLELRRIKTDLTMYFKIYNNLSALPSDYLACDNSVRTYHSRRKCEYIIQPFCDFVALSWLFITRQHTDAWYWYSKSVCLSVSVRHRLSVRNVPVSDENGSTYLS